MSAGEAGRQLEVLARLRAQPYPADGDGGEAGPGLLGPFLGLFWEWA